MATPTNAIIPASSAGSTTIPTVCLSVKLTSSNYFLWKMQLVPILKVYDLLGHVDGICPSPPVEINDAKNLDFIDWHRKDQLVLSWIISSVSENLLSQIVGTDTAFTAWQRLASAFASGSKAQIRTLKSQLFNVRRGNNSITNYMQRCKALSHNKSYHYLYRSVREAIPYINNTFFRFPKIILYPSPLQEQKNNLMSTMFVLFIFLSSLLWLSIKLLRNKEGKKAPPEAGGRWPIIGHLHVLTGPKPPHIVLADLADKYGPIFTIRMGVHRALVVSDSEMAKECLTTNDKAFATRPKSLASEILAYDGAMMGFSPYDSYWRENRKLVTLELLSNHRVESFKDSREAEVGEFTKELYKFWEVNSKSNGSDKVLVEMKRWFGDITLNLILKIVFGKSVGYMTSEKSGDSEEWKEALRVFFDLSGTFVVADALPFLRWLDIGGHEKAMKETAKRLDLVVEEWLKERKEKRASGLVNGDSDFMDLMLNILDGNGEATLGRDSDTVNKATCLVDHDDPQNHSLLKFNALWESDYRQDSLLVYSSGRSPTIYQRLRKGKPLLTPDITILSVGTEIMYGESMVRDEAWEQYLNRNWDRAVVLEETDKIPQLERQQDTEQRPHKVSFFLKLEKMRASEFIKALYEVLEKRGLDVKLVYSNGHALDVLPKGAGKGEALAYLLRKFEADGKLPFNTLVCGDSGNDAELFTVPGVYGVMVSNAQEELLQWYAENAKNNPSIIHATERCASGIIQAIGNFSLGPNVSPRDIRDFQKCKVEKFGPGHEVVKFYLFYERWRRAEIDKSEDRLQHLRSVFFPQGTLCHPLGNERPFSHCIDELSTLYGDKQGTDYRVWVDRVSSAQIGSDLWLVKFYKWESCGDQQVCCLTTVLMSSKAVVHDELTWMHMHGTWQDGTEPKDQTTWLF